MNNPPSLRYSYILTMPCSIKMYKNGDYNHRKTSERTVSHLLVPIFCNAETTCRCCIFYEHTTACYILQIQISQRLYFYAKCLNLPMAKFLPEEHVNFVVLYLTCLEVLGTNSVEMLISGVEIGSRFRCSIWMTIWNSLWRQETMQLRNLITISLVTAGAFTPSEHL